MIADGFQLKKSDDRNHWIMIFSAKKTFQPTKPIVWEDEQNRVRVLDQRLCVWPIVHSHLLVNQGLEKSVLALLSLIIVTAHLISTKRPASEPSQQQVDELLPEALESVSKLSVKAESKPTASKEVGTACAITK